MSSPATPSPALPERPFAGRYRAAPAEDDDPWAPVSRATVAEIQSRHAAPAAAPEAPPSGGELAGGQDVLDSLEQALKDSPGRADLWMMRFETIRALGRKGEFGAALQQAWSHPLLQRNLDVGALRGMWQELAPGEPLPDGVQLPSSPGLVAPAASAARDARFVSLAQRLAAQPLAALAEAYGALRRQPGFCCDMARKLSSPLQRPTPLQYATEMSRQAGGRVRLFLKREDLRDVAPETEAATAHAWLATALGRTRLLAGHDGDAQSLALAAAAATFGLRCTIVLRHPQLVRASGVAAELELLGAELCNGADLSVETDDPREAALRLWLRDPTGAHLALLTGAAPAPYPTMLHDLRALIGQETDLQLRAHAGPGRTRTFIAALHSEGDGIGLILPQLPRPDVELVFVEPAVGSAPPARVHGRHGAFNGAAAAHEQLRASGRATYLSIGDGDARRAQERVFRSEGVPLSLEDARAAAFAVMMAGNYAGATDAVVLAA